MATDASNVSYGKPKVGGAIYRAPVGTTLPTDATSELNEAFKSLGYISEDGLTNGNSIESDKIRAWGGDTVMYVNKGKEDTLKFKMIESLNVNVLKTIYGDDNVTGSLDKGIKVNVNSKDVGASAWVVDMILKGGVAKRVVVPSASITSMEDIVYKDGDPIGYGVTLSAEPDADGNTHTEYIVKQSSSEASSS